MFILLKENLRRLNTKIGVSGYVVSFETLDKEFISVARLTQGAAAKANTAQRLRVRQLGVKAPLVTGVRPETARSSPG